MNARSIAAVALAVAILSPISAARAAPPTTPWFTTWMSPPTNAATGTEFSGLTTRQVIHTSLGGASVRLRISNAYGTLPLIVGSVHIAVPNGPDTIDTTTDTAFAFGGSATVTIPPGAVAVSDPVSFALQQNTNYLVSLYTPSTTGAATSHAVAPHPSYFGFGNGVSAAKLSNEVVFSSSTFFVSGLDVAGSPSDTGVVTMGDSITDGYGAIPGTDGGWPDDLSAIVVKNGAYTFAISNDGASSSRLLSDLAPGVNLGGLARLDRDVLALPGVKVIILSLGINDIAAAPSAASPTPADVIAGYRQLVSRAHERNVIVYGATITPIGPFASLPFETKRQAINSAIRAGGIFDGVIDFDAAVRDPNTPTQLLAAYDSGDHLHPSSAGYQAMANIIAAGPW